MKRITQIPLAFTFLLFLLLMFVHTMVTLGQEKLSNVSKETAPLVVTKNYFQQISSDRTPITSTVVPKSNSPHFSQKFSQDNTTQLQEFEVKVPAPKRLFQIISEGSLSLDESKYQGSRIANVSCNDTPIGTNDIYVVGGNKTLTVGAPGFLVNDIDLEGEVLTATLIVDAVDHGTLLAFPNGSFTYMPSSGYIGIDQFQYLMRDASGNTSNPVTVTIEVREAGNRTPLGSNDSYGALASTTLNIAAPGFLANDIDQDGETLTATLIVDAVDHGTLSAFPNGSFSYTPDPGYTGTDQFQYKMRDSESNESEAITVTIQIYAGNRNPLGTDDHFGVVQNTSRSIPAPGFLMNDVDQDGNPITATLIVDNVDHGTLNAFPDGSFTYIPTPGYTGSDQFQYRMRDSEFNQSEDITVTLEVVGAGDLPFGFNDQYKAESGSALTIAAPGFLLNDIDQNGEALTAMAIVDGVDNGSLSAFPDGSFSYTPTPGFTGTDQFQYKMRDASFNQSEAITVTIEVGESYNRNPVGSNDQYAALANATLMIPSPGFLMNDIDQDGDVIAATLILDGVDNGSLSAFPDGSFSYTPNPGFTGTDQFQYRMRDSEFNDSEAITVTIEVYEGNRSPSGTNDAFAVIKNTTLNIAASGILVNDYDPDGDALTATVIVDGVDNGALAAFPDGSFSYTPANGFTGTDQFQYRMRDSEFNQSEVVTVLLEVFGPNEPPIALANNVTMECSGPSGTTVTLDGSDSFDPESGVLTFTWYEDNNIIAGPTTLATSDVVFNTGVHLVKLKVEDECGQSSEIDIIVAVEDTTGPLVEAILSPTGKPQEYMISCISSDVCSEIVTSRSLILIPELTNPSVSLKSKKGYSLEIDEVKNTVSVEAPDAAAFWAMVLADGGIQVDDGQVIDAKYDKNKYQFRFDSNGKLLSVKGKEIVLHCTAEDANGNTGMSEALLPLEGVAPFSEISSFSEPNNITIQHQNYPNPFSGTTTIRYNLPEQALVQISVFDLTGRLVKEFESKQMEAGDHAVTWDATGQKSGVYIYHIQYNNRQVTNKMTLLWR